MGPRSSILILSGALVLMVLRVRDPSIRLAAWVAVLCGSLTIPVLTAWLPKLPLQVLRTSGTADVPAAATRAAGYDASPGPKLAAPRSDFIPERSGNGVFKRFDRARTAIMIYALVALALLLRLGIGLAISLRLLRGSRATGHVTEGIEIRESDFVGTPVTLAIARPAIVLPGNWRQWESAKLDAVLAHERSHISRTIQPCN